MLNIRIDNPEIEKSIKQTYGEDSNTIAKAFFEFIKQQRNRQDIGISIQELESGKGIPLDDVIRDISSKYE
jgi:hypothetical protein